PSIARRHRVFFTTRKWMPAGSQARRTASISLTVAPWNSVRITSGASANRPRISSTKAAFCSRFIGSPLNPALLRDPNHLVRVEPDTGAHRGAQRDAPDVGALGAGRLQPQQRLHQRAGGGPDLLGRHA